MDFDAETITAIVAVLAAVGGVAWKLFKARAKASEAKWDDAFVDAVESEREKRK